MGGLTDNRKRFSDLSLLTPPLKKLKLSSLPSITDRTAPPPRFPPADPLRRHVHGPQRILRAFGLGSANSRRRSPSEMGNFLSQLLHREKSASGSDESLGLEEYKRLVVEVQEDVRSPEVRLPPLSEEPSDLNGLEMGLESTPVKEERVWVRKVPLYKQLYEDSVRKYESKLSSLEFEVKLTEKKILGFQIANEVLEKKPEENLLEPFAPLTEEDEVDVYHALQGGRRHEVLVIHEASNIEITRKVLQCLSYGDWLNDEVINLYLELLKERERREPKRFLKCHFFNTFFYKKLIGGRNGYDFKAVRRWTTQKKIGYGLVECDKVFVPIHKQVHWCLAVINVKDKKFQYLDSLGGKDTMVLQVLARYFMDEVMDKSGKQIDTMSWKPETVDDLPLQKNGWDCGMFMLKYTDFYSRGLSLVFGQEHMAYFRKRTAKEILRLRAE